MQSKTEMWNFNCDYQIFLGGFLIKLCQMCQTTGGVVSWNSQLGGCELYLLRRVNNVFIHNVPVLSKQALTLPLVIMQHIVYLIRINTYRISEYKFASSFFLNKLQSIYFFN